jgi:hypothetical protein
MLVRFAAREKREGDRRMDSKVMVRVVAELWRMAAESIRYSPDERTRTITTLDEASRMIKNGVIKYGADYNEEATLLRHVAQFLEVLKERIHKGQSTPMQTQISAFRVLLLMEREAADRVIERSDALFSRRVSAEQRALLDEIAADLGVERIRISELSPDLNAVLTEMNRLLLGTLGTPISETGELRRRVHSLLDAKTAFFEEVIAAVQKSP